MNDGFAKAKEHGSESHQAIRDDVDDTQRYLESPWMLAQCTQILF